MTNTSREADLSAMTAKALRPIAADLGITGASRMAKVDIITAIISATCEHGGPRNAFCAECNASKPEYAARVDEIKAMRARVLEPLHAEALEMNDEIAKDRLDVADFDEEAVYAQADQVDDTVPAELCAHGIAASYPCSICRENGNQITTPTVEVEAPKTLPTFVRRTRTRFGVETVVVEDVRGGKVFFRYIEHGKVSAQYKLREASFTARYMPVSR